MSYATSCLKQLIDINLMAMHTISTSFKCNLGLDEGIHYYCSPTTFRPTLSLTSSKSQIGPLIKAPQVPVS